MKLRQLAAVNEALPLTRLSEAQLRELQSALCRLGYPVGDIDGLWGPRTRHAWAEFAGHSKTADPTRLSPASVAALQEQLEKFGAGGDHDFSTTAATMAAIQRECRAQGIGLKTQIAYVLATVAWETNDTFQPVKEAYWQDEDWRRRHLRYFPYYGRGYVQLTWKKNYEKYAKILGIDLVNHPDKAMENNIALFILVHGFKTGTFTGRNISEYINEKKRDFINARRCINGQDRTDDIARLAEKYLQNMSNCVVL